MSRALVEHHEGQVPEDLEALTALPGVGRKTAHVVLGTAFGHPSGVVVDTHVKRLAFRLGLTEQNDPAKIERDRMKADFLAALDRDGIDALLTPTALALLPVLFPDPKERNTAFGVWGGVGALALAVGPFTGGYLSQHVSWGWIFLINVPIGVATVVMTIASIRAEERRARRSLDLPGLVTSAVALFSVTYALIEGESKGWTSGLILGAFALAAVAAAVFVLIEARAEHPMIPLALFRSRELKITRRGRSR